MQALQEVWNLHPYLQISDLKREFALAWFRMRNKFNDIQDEAKKSANPLDLYPRLVQLKLDILETQHFFKMKNSKN